MPAHDENIDSLCVAGDQSGATAEIAWSDAKDTIDSHDTWAVAMMASDSELCFALGMQHLI